MIIMHTVEFKHIYTDSHTATNRIGDYSDESEQRKKEQGESNDFTLDLIALTLTAIHRKVDIDNRFPRFRFDSNMPLMALNDPVTDR